MIFAINERREMTIVNKEEERRNEKDKEKMHDKNEDEENRVIGRVREWRRGHKGRIIGWSVKMKVGID